MTSFDANYKAGTDIIRIISGFGVVLLHVTDPFIMYPPYYGAGGSAWLILNIINTFFRICVPLFLMISGYLLLDPLKNYDFKTFYRKRFTKVGIPFVFWVIFYFFWINYIGNPLTPDIILNKFLSANVGQYNFLIIILELYLLSPFLMIFIKNSTSYSQRFLFISLCAFTILLSLINNLSPEARVLTGKNILTVFIPFISYFFAGYYLRNIKPASNKSLLAMASFLTLSVFTAFHSRGVISAYERQYESATVLIMTLLIFSVFINRGAQILKNSKLVNILKTYSGLIFGIYLIHPLVLYGLDGYYREIPGSISSPMWFYVLLKVLGVFFLSSLAVFIFKKIPYIKMLFGF